MTATRTSLGGASTREADVAASAGAGVLTAVIGYLATYAVIVSEVRDQFGDDVAEWKGVAWYYYNAHMVDVEQSGQFGGFGGSSTTNFIAESGSTSAELLYVIPPLVLVLAGAILAYRRGVRDLGEAVIVGAPITVGYFVVVAIGAFVAETSAEGSFFGVEVSGSIEPQLAPALLLAGVLYPLVFATVGAVLASAFDAR